jgi:hypothetical protein
MIHLLRAIVLLLVSAAVAAAMLAVLSAMPPMAHAPTVPRAQASAAPADVPRPEVPAAVRFMRAFVARANPSLLVEDPTCALLLPGAIYRQARGRELEWQRLLTLAWQESDFDCHAKNRVDRGGAYGPFQLRRLWSPVIGDPRPQYFDPELAVERVAEVIRYYEETGRYQHLIGRGFRNPLLCLYNTGETKRVNMRYCRRVGAKLGQVQQEWRDFLAAEGPPAAQAPGREGTAGAGRMPAR